MVNHWWTVTKESFKGKIIWKCRECGRKTTTPTKRPYSDATCPGGN